MANLVKRRVPLRIAGPIQAQPAPIVARIPKIRTILRASVITAGVVIAVRNPHASVAASKKVPRVTVVTAPARPRYNGFIDVATPPKTFLPRATKGRVNVIGATYNRPGSVVRTASRRSTIPNVKPFNSRVIGTNFNRAGYVIRTARLPIPNLKPFASRVILNTYKRNGLVARISSPRSTIPNVKPFNSRVILSTFRQAGSVIRIAPVRSTIPNVKPFRSRVILGTFRRDGLVVKVKNPLSVIVTTSRPKAPKVILATYRRDGKVYVSRHSNTVVIPVTSVRPKIVKVIPDLTDSYKRRNLPGRVGKAGPKVHPIVLQPYVAILASLDLTETWQGHFTSRGWANIQDQLNAGYPLYCEPTVINGSYEQVVDYGVTINNTIVTVRFSQNNISGLVNTVTKIATSLDGITYTGFTTASSLYSSSLRFVKFRLEFTAANGKSVTEITNLEFIVDTKTELDSGSIVANAGDVGGTQVFFNKVFKSIDSITLTVNSQEPVTAIYQFVSVPNPTSFFIFALDSSGNRTTYTVSWKARGVV